MTSVPEKPKVVRMEVLPPAATHSQPPLAPLGIPFLARMRNTSHTREFNSYTELELAANRHLAALAEQIELKGRLLERTDYWRGRASKLDLLRQVAADQVEVEVADFYRDAAINALSKDIRITQLKLQLKEARAALEQSPAPPTPPATPEQRSAIDDLRKLLAEVKAVDKAFDDHISAIVDAAGGEDRLGDDAREHIENIRLLKADKIQTIYESAR